MSAYVPPGFKLLRDFVSEAIDRKHSETSDTPKRLRSLQAKLNQTSNAGWGFFDRMDINADLPELRTRFESERKVIAGAILDAIRILLVHGKLTSVSIDRDGEPSTISPQWWIKSISYESLTTGRRGRDGILVIIDRELSEIYMKSFREERDSKVNGEHSIANETVARAPADRGCAPTSEAIMVLKEEPGPRNEEPRPDIITHEEAQRTPKNRGGRPRTYNWDKATDDAKIHFRKNIEKYEYCNDNELKSEIKKFIVDSVSTKEKSPEPFQAKNYSDIVFNELVKSGAWKPKRA